MKRSRIAVAVEDFKFSSRDKDNWDLLRIKKGDIITIHVPDDGNGWEYGELKDKTGNFPSKCIKRTSEYTSLQSSIPTIIQLEYVPSPFSSYFLLYFSSFISVFSDHKHPSRLLLFPFTSHPLSLSSI